MPFRDAGTVLAPRSAVFAFGENESTRAARGPRASASRRVTVTAIVVAVWLLSVGVGFAILIRYDQRSGQPADPQMRWPARSARALPQTARAYRRLGRPVDETARTAGFGCSLHDPDVGDAS